MSNGSSIPAVKTAIISALEARPGLAAVKVQYQEPLKASDVTDETTGNQDAIWLGSAATDGNGIRVEIFQAPLVFDESYTLELVIQAMRPKSDQSQSTVDTRAAVMLGEVIGAIAEDPTFGITGFTPCGVTSIDWQWEPVTLPTGQGHGAVIPVHIHFDATVSVT